MFVEQIFSSTEKRGWTTSEYNVLRAFLQGQSANTKKKGRKTIKPQDMCQRKSSIEFPSLTDIQTPDKKENLEKRCHNLAMGP